MTLIRPLTLGSRCFPVNLVQGPLAGISCAPFRRLIWEYSQPAFSYTEMMSCKTVLYQSKSKIRFLAKDPHEGPVCFQLSGSEPHELGEAVKVVTAHGADLIDLNCGCPVTKIRSRGAGSKLLMDPLHLATLIAAMKSNTSVPVSIKIRVDGHSTDRFNQQMIEMLNESGVDFVTVHGRHWTEGYDIPCHHDQIALFRHALKVPVLGNGDVACVGSLKTMLSTGCAGAMVARASVGQPWLIGQWMAEIQGKPFQVPSVACIGVLFFQHVKELACLLSSEKFALLQARKFAKYYARCLPQRHEFCEALTMCERLQEVELLCMKFFS